MPYCHRFALFALLLAALPAAAQGTPIPTDLADYVARPEPAFKWSRTSAETTDAGTVTTLRLTSQTWHDEVWEHDLQVFRPAGVDPKATMVLYNTGGKPSTLNVLVGNEIAKRVKAPVAILYGIPKQPIYDKKEDALIAETFVRYLQTGDGTWPLLFPMVKSVVKAMDAVQAFAKEEWKTEVTGFVVTGASKRGWTSWLTAASGDKRVKGIAPMVIDTLNFQKQMPNQLRSFGRYSEMIHDYEEAKLLPMPDTAAARKLWAMVDPWVYRERLTLPKMIINGTNDPYWAQDALNLYWDDLPGPKWICYVPNAGHGLRPEATPNVKGGAIEPFPTQAINALSAFARSVVDNKPLPKLTWANVNGEGGPSLEVESDVPPVAVRGWTTESETRDFRRSKWAQAKQASAITSKGVLTVGPGGAKYRAMLGEAEYERDGLRFTLSTQIRILESAK